MNYMEITLPNYSYVFNFEEEFKHQDTKLWMMKNWTNSFYFCGIYMILIFGGQHYMQNRPRFELRGVLSIWNIALAVFSFIGACRTAPEFFHVLKNYGFYHSVCIPRLPSLKEIGGDAERAFVELHSCWEEENLSKEEMCKNMNAIRQELLLFWEEKIREGKLHVLKYKVKNIRTEIEIWWEKCFLSEDEKQEFEAYKSTNYTDRLLDCHIEELERLKRKFCRSESLYLLIRKHQDTWRRVVNMDKQLYNPERLFQNRGAQLLQEERDRRAAQKDLPQLEELIKKETELFEREHGRPFLVYGMCFSDMISHQKEQHKENQKSLKSAKKKCENCAAPSNVPKMTTSISKLKRKLDSNTQSPAAAQTKQARVASCDKLASHPAEVCHPKLHMPVRRKLIERTVSVPVIQP